MEYLLEEVVLATLHKVGPLRILDNFEFSKIFDSKPEPFTRFKLHRHYDMCEPLVDVLCTLNHAGLIYRESPDLRYFRASERVLGEYGENLYHRFSLKHQKVIDEVASELKDVFGQNDPAKSLHSDFLA